MERSLDFFMTEKNHIPNVIIVPFFVSFGVLSEIMPQKKSFEKCVRVCLQHYLIYDD